MSFDLGTQDRFIERVREVAWDCGYAVGVHGSRQRDLDLMAVPWTERAIAPQHLVEALLKRLDLYLKPHPEPELLTNPTRMPNGRIAYALMGAPACHYLDLSVFPPGAVRKLLVSRIGLTEEEAHDCL